MKNELVLAEYCFLGSDKKTLVPMFGAFHREPKLDSNKLVTELGSTGKPIFPKYNVSPLDAYFGQLFSAQQEVFIEHNMDRIEKSLANLDATIGKEKLAEEATVQNYLLKNGLKLVKA